MLSFRAIVFNLNITQNASFYRMQEFATLNRVLICSNKY